MIAAQPITPPVRLVDSLQKWKIGIVSLSTDLTLETDFYAMRPDSGIGFYVNRVAFANPTTRENLLAMLPRISETAKQILPDIRLDALAYGCTSASAVIGDERVRQALNLGKPDTPCVTPTTGAIEGFRRLGLNRVSLVAPYIESVSEALADYFISLGLDIVSLHCMGIEDDRDIALVSHESILNCAQQAAGPHCDALFLACTALPAVPILGQLEALTGKPVVSSNQALFWQAVRCAGFESGISGYGRLLELPGR